VVVGETTQIDNIILAIAVKVEYPHVQSSPRPRAREVPATWVVERGDLEAPRRDPHVAEPAVAVVTTREEAVVVRVVRPDDICSRETGGAHRQ